MAKLTDTEREMFERFTIDYPFCWACGHSGPRWSMGREVTPRTDYPRTLERAHILGGASRKHDRRNLAMLCKLCHDLTHGAVVRVDDKPLPSLRLDHVLWLQGCFEGKVDRKYLRMIGLRQRILPPGLIVPRWFQREFKTRHGCTHQQWKRGERSENRRHII